MGFGSIIGGIAGGLLSSKSQESANAQNLEIANNQMKFQKHMSDTSVQRRVQDMRKAGLNPLLSVSGASAGASTPQGASATMQKTVDPAVFGQLLTSVANARVAEAQKKKIESETVTQESNQLKTDLANAQLELQNKNLSSSERRALEEHVKKLKLLNAQTGYINSQSAFNDSKHKAFNSDIANTEGGQKASFFKNLLQDTPIGDILNDMGDSVKDGAKRRIDEISGKKDFPVKKEYQTSDRARGKTSTSGWDKKPNKSGYDYKLYKGRSNARR